MPETLKSMPLQAGASPQPDAAVARTTARSIVATGDPFDVYALDELQTLTGLHVHAGAGQPARDRPAHQDPFRRRRRNRHRHGRRNATRTRSSCSKDSRPTTAKSAKQAQEASVVKLVNEILIEAANEQASDIHIEPEEDGLRIRYRIDGMLQTQTLPPEINRFQAAIISRIKIMARLNIAEKRLPQDGRIKMRVQQPRDRRPRLDHPDDPRRRHRHASARQGPHGVQPRRTSACCRTPTRPFKQDDRPAARHRPGDRADRLGQERPRSIRALNEIKDETTKIITVEDPVEYQQPGISQIQVHSKIGLTFAAGLRSILRHDPDVILIGEMRDMETAESRHPGVADRPPRVQHAAHQRCAQRLHASDRHGHRAVPGGEHGGRRDGPAAGADDLPGLQGGVRAGTRTTCPTDFPVPAGGQVRLWKGAAAARAVRRGFRGRTGIHELMVTGDTIREMCVQRVNAVAHPQPGA